MPRCGTHCPPGESGLAAVLVMGAAVALGVAAVGAVASVLADVLEAAIAAEFALILFAVVVTLRVFMYGRQGAFRRHPRRGRRVAVAPYVRAQQALLAPPRAIEAPPLPVGVSISRKEEAR